MKIRRAEITDAEDLSKLAHELNLYHHEDIKPKANSFVKDWGKFDAYVAVDDEKIVGFLAGFDNYQFHTATARFEIQNLHVSATHRRRGIARKLCQSVIADKYEQGVRQFSVSAEKQNINAISFYKEFGFEKRIPKGQRFSLKIESLDQINKVNS